MPTIQIEPLKLGSNSNFVCFDDGRNKQQCLEDLNVSLLEKIYGGRLPTSEELAVILALRNTDPSRDLTGAILDGKNIELNILIAGPGTGNNGAVQVNGSI